MTDFTLIPLKTHSILLLPFTTSILSDPSEIISTILNTLPKSSKESFTIILTTPPQITNKNDQEQLYTKLLLSPKAHFETFQTFLGRIYSALATAQSNAGKILMDVEVHFDGEKGSWENKIFRNGIRSNIDNGSDSESEGEYQILTPDGVFIPPQLNEYIPSIPQISLPPIPDALDQDGHILEISSPSFPSKPEPGPRVVALGGTFDHLHAAHKLLLHLSHFLVSERLIVGLMSDTLLNSKKHFELVENLDRRINGVESFLNRLGGSVYDDKNENSAKIITQEKGKRIKLDVKEITDAYGPTAYENDIDALIVSKETLSGGLAVNNKRKENNLTELEIFVIDVIGDQKDSQSTLTGQGLDESILKELKMGSTGIRNWIYQQNQNQSQKE
ncbi:uncharacterized protein L201_005005 [Kwoniella dendrophila CBS 6074]|uniref:Cytidyltransferase-like domain-containing protein n=1 Tax=Kwoniella dendrophila CBS 6074 TaxID=1295534 RepID=A0AAX4JZD1_9TREE